MKQLSTSRSVLDITSYPNQVVHIYVCNHVHAGALQHDIVTILGLCLEDESLVTVQTIWIQ